MDMLQNTLQHNFQNNVQITHIINPSFLHEQTINNIKTSDLSQMFRNTLDLKVCGNNIHDISLNFNAINSYTIGHDDAFFLCNMGIGDMIVTAGIIEYLTTKYNSVTVVCRPEHERFLSCFHEGNNKIKPFPYKEEFKSSCGWTFPRELTDIFNTSMDIYAIGHYSQSGKIDIFPTSYYDDIKLPIKYIHNIHFTTPNYIMNYYDELKSYGEYIVVHQIGSTCKLDLIDKYNINIEKTLTIDVNKNLYKIGHRFYNIANKFINLYNPLWYITLLENASELYLVDSCIHALAAYLSDTSKAKRKVCISRATLFTYAQTGFEYVNLINKRMMDGSRFYMFEDDIRSKFSDYV